MSARHKARFSFGALAFVFAFAGGGAASAQVRELEQDQSGYAIEVRRTFTMNNADQIFERGLIVTRGTKIEYVGPKVDLPAGYQLVERANAWAYPGLVDLHTHIHSGGWGDINTSIVNINAELSATPAYVPSNKLVQRACSAGVTTLLGIPGSATGMGGFGILYKSKTHSGFDASVLANPGGLKVAQTHNPDRRNGAILRSWAGLGWLLEDINDKAVAALKQDRFDPQLENLKRVHAGELPVLIHTAGVEGAAATARMWRRTYNTRSVLSHGSFDGWKAAEFVASLGMPVNHGPRTTDFYSTLSGRIEPTAWHFANSGGPNFSLNTDSGIIPQEEFFLQGAMAARQGCDSYAMLRAMTIHPARAFGYDDRVGSLERGKDADIVISTGDPLDPRSHVLLVLIDGEIQYERSEDGSWF